MKTGQAIPGGFAIIVGKAQGAELRDHNDGTAGFVFVISQIPKSISNFFNLDCENRWKNLKQLKSNPGKPPMSHV